MNPTLKLILQKIEINHLPYCSSHWWPYAFHWSIDQPCGSPDSGNGGPAGDVVSTGAGVGFGAATGVGAGGIDVGGTEGIGGADFTAP